MSNSNHFQPIVTIAKFRDWLFRANGSAGNFVGQRALISIAGMYLVGLPFILTGLQIRDTTDHTHLILQLLFALMVSPVIENAIIVVSINISIRFNSSQVLAALLSALVMSGFHGLISLVWGVVVFWAFFVYAASYIGWRNSGRKRAFLVSVLIHSLTNLPGSIALVFKAL